MDNFNNLCQTINENSIADIFKSLLTGQQSDNKVIQPMDNIGQSGAIKSVQTINIAKTEDGHYRITTDNLCVKLSPLVIEALIKFVEVNKGV